MSARGGAAGHAEAGWRAARWRFPVGANSKNAMVPLTTVDTRNILFICGGAFPDLPDIIKERAEQAVFHWLSGGSEG